MDNVLIYGATGYTGSLIAERAAGEGAKPSLAGRSEGKLRLLAERLGCPYRVVDLTDQPRLEQALAGVDVVLHCAGPFSRTARPMVAACLRTKTHYLDITGEIDVFEDLATCDQAAKEAGVMILPGVGFDVVPTDCLALHLARRLKDATHLTLAFTASSLQLSHGTTVTSLENVGRGAVRRDGKIARVPAAHKTMRIDFDGKETNCVAIPWGDVATAFYSTGIPNIEVFLGAPAATLRSIKASRYLGPLLRSAPMQWLLRRRVPQGGPDESIRQTGETRLWGQVKNANGDSVEAHLRTPEAYQVTILTALAIAKRAASGEAPVGFQTPAKAYGPDLILDVPGTTRS